MGNYNSRISLRKEFVERLKKIDGFNISHTDDFHGFAIYLHETRMIYFLDDKALFVDNVGNPCSFEVAYDMFAIMTTDIKEGRVRTLEEYIESVFNFLNVH